MKTSIYYSSLKQENVVVSDSEQSLKTKTIQSHYLFLGLYLMMILPFPLFHNQKGQTGLIAESITDLLIVDADLLGAECKLTDQTDLMFSV